MLKTFDLLVAGVLIINGVSATTIGTTADAKIELA